MQLPASEAWAVLMRNAQDGDAASYMLLLRQIVPVLRRMLHGRVPQQMVEDVVQETLLTLHRMRNSYDPARPFLPWIGAIAHRRAVDALRRVARSPVTVELEEAIALGDPATPADEAMDDARAARRLRAAIAALPPRQMQAVSETKLKELTLTEASAVTGQSETALKVNVHRAMLRLRRLLGDEAA